MPSINLLPPEIKARQKQRKTLLIIGSVGAGILVFLLIVLFVQRSTIRSEEDKLRVQQGQAAQLQADVARLQVFGDLQARLDQRKAVLLTALTGDVAWSTFLNDLSLIAPDNSWLVNMAVSAVAGQSPNGQPTLGTVSFSGLVFDFPGLAGWLTRIGQIRGLTFVYLTNGTRTTIGSKELVSFASSAFVTDPLLSKRCQAGVRCP